MLLTFFDCVPCWTGVTSILITSVPNIGPGRGGGGGKRRGWDRVSLCSPDWPRTQRSLSLPLTCYHCRCAPPGLVQMELWHTHVQMGMGAQALNPSTPKVEAGGALWVWSQPTLHSESQASWGYVSILLSILLFCGFGVLINKNTSSKVLRSKRNGPR